jgi:hypothetical protein
MRLKELPMPDLDQIKQGEQVTTSALEGSAWRFAGIPSVGITDAVEVLVFLIQQLLRWLLFGCKNSQERPRATCFRKGGPAMLPAPPDGFYELGHMGCRAVAPPNSVRSIHNRGNLACRPDFKVSHYPGRNRLHTGRVRV